MASITSFPFGRTADGHEVTAWQIQNGSMSATFIDYGATVQALTVPDKNGSAVDVVLGYRTVREYEENSGFVGATIGRFANRIGKAEFSLGGKCYRLEKNDGDNQLHGGLKGFDRQLWRGSIAADNTVTFSRLSPDGEENYPGNLSVSVSYTLTEDALVIRYDADTDADTIVNLTNHSYFNLNGGGSVLAHQLQISARQITENDENCLPTGRFLPVEGTPFDFRQPKPIGRDIDADNTQLHYGKGYDHNFVLSGAHDAAVLWSEQSGICMTLHTDMPGVQVYSANNLDPRADRNGALWSYRQALCLETQLFPNAMRCYGFPSPVLHMGEHLHRETSYVFSLR